MISRRGSTAMGMETFPRGPRPIAVHKLHDTDRADHVSQFEFVPSAPADAEAKKEFDRRAADER